MDLQLPMLPVTITTDVVSSNLGQGEVYNVMRQVDIFSPVSSIEKTDRHEVHILGKNMPT
jgi:hypothetical protein